jgi:ketosteroid isomerase-like protein
MGARRFGVGADLLASDFEWHQFPRAVEPGTRRGAEVGGALRKIFEVYEDLRVDVREFIDAGDEVVAIGRTRATAKGSGLQLDNQSPWCGRCGMAS